MKENYKIMAKKKTTKKVSGKKAIIGLGILSAGVVAYLLTGERAKKTKKTISDWSERIKKETVKEVKKLKTITKDEYHEILSSLAKKYEEVDKEEVKKTIEQLKKQWSSIKKTVTPKKEKVTKKK